MGYIFIPCKILELFPGIEIFWNPYFIIVVLLSVDTGNIFSNSEQILQDKKEVYTQSFTEFPPPMLSSLPKMFCKLSSVGRKHCHRGR